MKRMESKNTIKYCWIVSSVLRYHPLQSFKKGLPSTITVAKLHEWICENGVVVMKNVSLCTKWATHAYFTTSKGSQITPSDEKQEDE